MTLFGLIIFLIVLAVLLPFLKKFTEVDGTLMNFVYALIGLAIVLVVLSMFGLLSGFPSVRLN